MWSAVATLCVLLLWLGSGLLAAALVIWLVLFALGIDVVVHWRFLASCIGGLISLYVTMLSAVALHARRKS